MAGAMIPGGSAGSARQPARDRQYAMLAVGLAMAARIVRDRRPLQGVILFVIALAAAAGLAREGQSRSISRLAAWDRRQRLRYQRTVKLRRQ